MKGHSFTTLPSWLPIFGGGEDTAFTPEADTGSSLISASYKQDWEPAPHQFAPHRHPLSHLAMVMALRRKFSNFFRKESVSAPQWLCPTGLWQGQHCSSSAPPLPSSSVSKRVSALLVGSRKPARNGGERLEQVAKLRWSQSSARNQQRSRLTLVTVVVDKELRILGQLLPQDQVVGDVAVRLCGGLPAHDQVGRRVGHGDYVPRHCRG